MTGYEAKVERLNTEFSLDEISDIVNEKMEELIGMKGLGRWKSWLG